MSRNQPRRCPPFVSSRLPTGGHWLLTEASLVVAVWSRTAAHSPTDHDSRWDRSWPWTRQVGLARARGLGPRVACRPEVPASTGLVATSSGYAATRWCLPPETETAGTERLSRQAHEVDTWNSSDSKLSTPDVTHNRRRAWLGTMRWYSVNRSVNR